MQAVIPNNCRVALTWLDHGRKARDILRCCSDLRRLYLVTCARAPQETDVLASILRDPRVELVELRKDEHVSTRLRPLFDRDNLLFVEGRVSVFIPDDQRCLEKETSAALESYLMDYTRSTVSRVALRITRGWHMLANGFLNLPRALREHSVDELRELARGRPVVVVGAGPSLDRTVDALASRRSKAVIVACDGAWSTIEQAGIVPDFIASTDDSEKIWRFFARRKANQTHVPVIGLPQSSWPAFRYHRGPFFLGRGQSPLDTALETAMGPVPVFDTGQCVGHAALEAARLLGGSPIILTGFDLAYDGDRFHPRDMPLPYFHHHPPCAENLTTVPGNKGGALKTDLSMVIYLREFERRIAAMDVPVLNATDGGARIAGARCVDLASTLDEFNAAPPLAVPFGPPSTAHEAGARLSLFQKQWLESVRALLQDISSAPAIHELADNVRDLPVFLKRHETILDLLSVAENPVEHAALKFAWDDWVRGGAATIGAGEVQRTAKHYLESTFSLARLIPSLLAMEDESSRHRSMTSRVLSIPGPAGESPSMTRMKTMLTRAGFEIADGLRDGSDLPSLWSEILASKAGIVLSGDGAVIPAGWAMPGNICIDIRTRPPNDDIIVPEHWLPGYAVVCPTLALARPWRASLPDDRPVFALPQTGGTPFSFDTLYSVGSLRRDWSIHEMISCLRAEVSPGRPQLTRGISLAC